MKRRLLSGIAAFCMLITSGSAQYSVYPVSGGSAKPTENGIFYSLPQNSFKIRLTIEETCLVRGIYSDFARQLLKLDAIEEDATLYEIKDIRIDPETSPDPNQVFCISGLRLPRVNLSPEGLLLSVNEVGSCEKGNLGLPEPLAGAPVPPEAASGGPKGTPKPQAKPAPKTFPGGAKFPDPLRLAGLPATYTPVTSLNADKRFDTTIRRYENDSVLVIEKVLKPYVDEKSLFEQAKKVADRILKIQADQSDLLSGLQEVAYPEGTMEFMYRQLEKNERRYLECFTGTMHKRTVVYEFSITPVEGKLRYPFAFFSFEDGLEAIETDRAEEFPSDNDLLLLELSLLPDWGKETGKLVVSGGNKEKAAGPYYRIPRMTEARIMYNGNELCRKKLPVSQWGQVLSLPVRPEYILLLHHETGAIRYFGMPDTPAPVPVPNGKKK